MILKPLSYIEVNYNVTNKEFDELKKICFSWRTPYIQHGVSRANPSLYRILKSLQDKNLIRRKGYRYCPTKHGWICLFRYSTETNLKTTKSLTTFTKRLPI